MEIAEFIQGYPIQCLRGSERTRVSAIRYDSRQVQQGDLFVALPGFHVDGQTFIAHAVRQGAAAVLCRSLPKHCHPSVTYIVVTDPRQAFSLFSDLFWNKPSLYMYVIGITGTDGKSTTVHIAQQLLEASGTKSGFISTVARKSAGEITTNTKHLTTPEAFELHEQLAMMHKNGKQYAVIEASSHSLSAQTKRLADVRFNAGLICNITHEHLEFHGSFAQYRSDKAELLRKLCPDNTQTGNRGNAVAVLNALDPSAAYCASQSNIAPCYFAQNPQNDVPKGDLIGRIIHDSLSDSQLELYYRNTDRTTSLPFPAAINAENVLAALLLVGKCLDTNPLELCPFLQDISLPSGRMQQIYTQPAVFIDYAHTPAAFQRLFPFMRSHTRGKLIAVFGSAGERDTKKRPLQGKIAGAYADIIILCNEDPRNEDPETILQDIAAGLADFRTRGGRLICNTDREEAITKAIELAQKEDTVLLLGKGHEQSILCNNKILPWSEEDAAQQALRRYNHA